MKKHRIPTRFDPDASDAIAMFEDGLMVYCNNAFEKLYNPLKYDVRERFDQSIYVI